MLELGRLRPSEEGTQTLTSGALARLVGVGVETLRYYEREGLLAVPRRSRSGYRRYPPSSVARLRFITRAKHLGFTLREIRELLELREGGACERVRSRAETKLDDVRARIRELRRIERALGALADACSSTDAMDACPFLEALEGAGANDAAEEHEAPSRRRARRVGTTSCAPSTVTPRGTKP